MKLLTPIVLAVAALIASPAMAADAKKQAAKVDCAEQATMPQAKSEKARADVKAGAKGAVGECDASPSPKAASTKSRKEVKEETQKAMKEGNMPGGEASEAKKKP
jgi:hypothetical protein